MLRIVNTTEPFYEKIGLGAAVRAVCEAGFEGIDLSMAPMYFDDFSEKLSEISSIAREYSVPFVQAHGPIGSFAYSDKEGRAEFTSRAHRALLVAGELGIEQVIFHPMRFPEGEHADQLGMNLEVYDGIVRYAKSVGTKIAIENMCGYKKNTDGASVKHVCKTPEELSAFVDAFADPTVRACLDTGHAIISGESPAEFARMLGADRLIALHIHDSDGVNDLHTAPFHAKIEWDHFARALSDIGYTGDITLEAVRFMYTAPNALIPSYLAYMRSIAAHIRDSIALAK